MPPFRAIANRDGLAAPRAGSTCLDDGTADTDPSFRVCHASKNHQGLSNKTTKAVLNDEWRAREDSNP